MCNDEGPDTYSVLLFVKHEGSNSLTLIGVGPGVACSDNLYINLHKFWQLKSITLGAEGVLPRG